MKGAEAEYALIIQKCKGKNAIFKIAPTKKNTIAVNKMFNPFEFVFKILEISVMLRLPVTEKKKHQTNGYDPVVLVTTKKQGDHVMISVKDNGEGVPQKVLDKIFQPFFTTKPTGKGTGLGLSMSYDIVIKGHSGDIKVESTEGEGAEFIITLPINA
jgi:light-regulated signal transduction histidine kinase (bacteriophytochrome)